MAAADCLEKHIGSEVRSIVWAGDTTGDEPLHLFEVLSIERLEGVRVVTDVGDDRGDGHTRSSPMGS